MTSTQGAAIHFSQGDEAITKWRSCHPHFVDFHEGTSECGFCPRNEWTARLPACNVTLKEGNFPAWQVKNGAMVSVPPYPQCGIAQSAADVYGGKFDVIMVDISCPHCSQKMSGPIDSWIDCQCHSCGKTVIEV